MLLLDNTEFTPYWKQPQSVIYELLRDDGCASAYAASAIVRYHWIKTGSLERAITIYHTGPRGAPAEMARYLSKYQGVLTDLLHAARRGAQSAGH